jgi:hypothetical protein
MYEKQGTSTGSEVLGSQNADSLNGIGSSSDQQFHMLVTSPDSEPSGAYIPKKSSTLLNVLDEVLGRGI